MAFFEAFWEQQATLILLSLTCFDISLLIFTLVQIRKFRGLPAVEASTPVEDQDSSQTPESVSAKEFKIIPSAPLQVKPVFVALALALTLAATSGFYFYNQKNKNSKVVLKNGDEILSVNGKTLDSGKPAFEATRATAGSEAPTVTVKVKSKDGAIVEKKVRAPTNPGAPRAK